MTTTTTPAPYARFADCIGYVRAHLHRVDRPKRDQVARAVELAAAWLAGAIVDRDELIAAYDDTPTAMLTSEGATTAAAASELLLAAYDLAGGIAADETGRWGHGDDLEHYEACNTIAMIERRFDICAVGSWPWLAARDVAGWYHCDINCDDTRVHLMPHHDGAPWQPQIVIVAMRAAGLHVGREVVFDPRWDAAGQCVSRAESAAL